MAQAIISNLPTLPTILRATPLPNHAPEQASPACFEDALDDGLETTATYAFAEVIGKVGESVLSKWESGNRMY
jgi:hypothetical protein